MTHLRRNPALGDRQPLSTGDGQASLGEMPFIGKLVLRGRHDVVSPAVERAIGLALPAAVLGTAGNADATICWLGPDEWWIFTGPGGEAALQAKLAGALSGTHHQLVDVTDYYTTIELNGARARDMLMTMTTIDLDSRAFAPGHCVVSNFGRATPLVHMTGDEAFEITIRISMADYMWCLLAKAGTEFGLPRQEPKGQVRLHRPKT